MSTHPEIWKSGGKEKCVKVENGWKCVKEGNEEIMERGERADMGKGLRKGDRSEHVEWKDREGNMERAQYCMGTGREMVKRGEKKGVSVESGKLIIVSTEN